MLTATLTDTTSHPCTGPGCVYCAEPREIMLLRRVHIRPVLEEHRSASDVELAGLVMDELRPLLLAALRIRQQAADWADSGTAAVAESGRHIISHFTNTPWELKNTQKEPIPDVEELTTMTGITDVHNPDDLLPAPPQEVRQAPPGVARVCDVIRTVDVTGVSGVGVIGQGFQAADGAMSWRWFGGPPQNQPKWEVYDNHGPDPFEQISGHTGNTKLVWHDVPEDTGHAS